MKWATLLCKQYVISEIYRGFSCKNLCLRRHAASSYGEIGILEFLVSLGADVNIRDNDGDTPLLVAETPAAFEALVQFGADPQAKNKAGEGIVEKVIEDERPELFEYLVERGFVTDGNLIAQVRAALRAAGEDTGGASFEVINEGDEENEDEDGMQM
jgi:hypothetical protein